MPDAVVQSRKNQYATNDPVLMGKVNLIQRTVRMMDERNQIDLEVRDVNRQGRNLTPRQSDTLERRGVSFEPVTTSLQTGFEAERRSKDYADQRKQVDSCAAANRPDSNQGSGGGRPFVPWCSKKGGR